MAATLGISVINILLALLLAPLLEGLMRRIRAVVQSRQGPPLLQPYYDLAKLFLKQERNATENFVFRAAPVLCLGTVLLAALFTPMGTAAPLGFAGDAIVLVYLLTLSAVCVILGGMASGSAFAYIGSAREMMLLLVVEPVLVITLLVGAIKAQSLVLSDITAWYALSGLQLSLIIAGLAFFMAIQAELAKLPFDLAEAETELMEGPFIEYSGPKLALFKWAFFAKQVVFASLFLEIFFPWVKTGTPIVDVGLHVLKLFVVTFLIELVAVLSPRLKINQTIQYYAGVIVFALAGMALAFIGY